MVGKRPLRKRIHSIPKNKRKAKKRPKKPFFTDLWFAEQIMHLTTKLEQCMPWERKEITEEIEDLHRWKSSMT